MDSTIRTYSPEALVLLLQGLQEHLLEVLSVSPAACRWQKGICRRSCSCARLRSAVALCPRPSLDEVGHPEAQLSHGDQARRDAFILVSIGIEDTAVRTTVSNKSHMVGWLVGAPPPLFHFLLSLSSCET